MNLHEAIGTHVHMLIWRRGITQRELAAGIGLQEAAVSRKLRGRARWSLDELYATAAYLGLEPAGLLPQQSPPAREGKGAAVVAGAGFEPATSGLRASPDRSRLRLIPGGTTAA